MKQERVGGWIETSTGIEFYPYDPRANEVDIKDIAHALSQICRFNGHTKWHYSVAQHSWLCARLAKKLGHSDMTCLYCLLHDAAEAYICDIPSPIKPDFRGYKDLEDKLQHSILQAFGLPPMIKRVIEIVKDIDTRLLHLEARTLLPVAKWAEQTDTQGLIIEKLEPWSVEQYFLTRYKELSEAVKLSFNIEPQEEAI